MSQDSPKTSPRRAEDGRKQARDRPKTGPRQARDGPTWPKTGPRCSKTGPRLPKTRPKMLVKNSTGSLLGVLGSSWGYKFLAKNNIGCTWWFLGLHLGCLGVFLGLQIPCKKQYRMHLVVIWGSTWGAWGLLGAHNGPKQVQESSRNAS